MMYPFMTLSNDTEITHSEMKPDGSVKVYIETPDETGGFHSATCWLPEYRWKIFPAIPKQKWHISSNSCGIMPILSSNFLRKGAF